MGGGQVRSDAGQRLLPTVIDGLALEEPDRILYKVAVGEKVSDGFQETSVATYANAINRVAWWLEKELGRSTTIETLGYMGPGKELSGFWIFSVTVILRGYSILHPHSSRHQSGLQGKLAFKSGGIPSHMTRCSSCPHETA